MVDYSKWDTLANQLSDSSDNEDNDHDHAGNHRLSTRQVQQYKTQPRTKPASKTKTSSSRKILKEKYKLKLDRSDLPQIDYGACELSEVKDETGDEDSSEVSGNDDSEEEEEFEGYRWEFDSDYDETDPWSLPRSGFIRYPGEGKAVEVATNALKRIEAYAKDALPYSKKYYTLHIRLRHTTRPIWRRARVPGGTSLAMLHDKVICPVVGWVRNYHTYLFTLPTSQYASGFKPKNPKFDVGFGPVRGKPVDMMHATRRRGGSAMVEDTRVCLADLVRRPGDCVKYVYDFGYQWEHLITVEKIQDELQPGEKPFQVLGGIRACPPEDSGGMRAYMETLQILQRKSKTKEYYERLREVKRARNYRDKPATFEFDPDHFDMEAAQRAMEEALNSKLQRMDDSNMVNIRLGHGEPNLQKTDTRVCGNCGKKQSELKGKLKRCIVS
ncbi:hypothetical protein HK102_013518 [Quaeritorhiza haematococci]|nr:hypothetical protein HK102_013518 [Quaeritorhiza haematococci]